MRRQQAAGRIGTGAVWRRRTAVGVAVWAYFAALVGPGRPADGAAGDSTARLAEFADRFRAEVYPVLARGANGCRACHGAGSSQTFRVLESPAATFSLMLERDLLNPADPMAVPKRLTSTDGDLRMPKAGALDKAEVNRLVQFANDLARALGAGDSNPAAPADERFPDSLLLPYDGPDVSDRAPRRLSYFQLKRSVETIFGAGWLAGSGQDTFKSKAHSLGGADFRSSFDQSRTITASYISAWQEIAREIARRYVSAPHEARFPGFDPDVFVKRSPRKAESSARALYRRILFAEPSEAELDRALRLVRALQSRPPSDRVVRFKLNAADAEGRSDSREFNVTLRAARASVSRHFVNQASAPEGEPWVRVGDRPFPFRQGNPDHFVRVVARPGNHVTVFDAVRFVRVRDGGETGDAVVLDNLDPECTFSGQWTPVAKEGELSRAGGPKKKYESDLGVVGSNHLEWRSVENRLAAAQVVARVPEDGEYNVYLNSPRVPRAATAAMVEVHSDAGSDPPVVQDGRDSPGFATVFMDQTESTLDAEGDSQWEMVHREVLMAGREDYVEISNRGVDPTSHVVVADAVKFVPVSEGPEIVVDNASGEGFEASGGWAPDQLVRNLPGRGKMHGDDVLHFPPSKSGEPVKDRDVDPNERVWARYRPVQGGEYRPGWYSVHVWAPGGHTHADWVAVDIHGSSFAPIVNVEAPPAFHVGEVAFLNASRTYHPAGTPLRLQWSHNAGDLGLRLDGASTPVPTFGVPPLRSPRPGWAGLIEALLQRPEFVMPADGPDTAPVAMLVRTALDLIGRVPTVEEVSRFEREGRIEPLIDWYLASQEFRDFFFHRARGVFRSRGTPDSDEPARLWAYIAANDLSYRQLFTADYTVGTDWKKTARRPVHGPTGFLTMRGYLEGRPGLPKFTYPAQVLTFALGVQFEVSDAVEAARENVVSTTDPDSICYSCHKLLTPLAFQRERWDEHGHYRSVDEGHELIDDSDRGVIPDYPFKGIGMEAFASQVVRKEGFVRAFVNQHHDMLFHRPLRVFEDQRDEYRQLYDFAMASDLRIRPLLKKMVMMRLADRPDGA